MRYVIIFLQIIWSVKVAFESFAVVVYFHFGEYLNIG